MTESDYVLSLMAIVSGLAITHMIASFYGLLAERNKVEFDWLAVTAAGAVAYYVLYGWWVTWSGFHLHTGPLPFWRFLMPMASVTGLVLAARAALPDRVPETGLNLRDRYDVNGVWIWRALLATVCISTSGTLLRLYIGERFGSGAAPWGLLGLCLTIVMLAALALTKSRRLHAVLVPAHLALLVAATLTQPV
jgi:hypothetical protein